ncbi:MAG: DNA internalization-related competence protein ComEC/Rec2 [Hespellia sp.]|nr:DNA internalization-related competence protein ComEC/Rec2 [Hespellia sp.]
MKKRPLCSLILFLLLLRLIGVGWTRFRTDGSSPPEGLNRDGSRILCAGVVCRREETSDYHIYDLEQVQIASNPEHLSKIRLIIYQKKEEVSQRESVENALAIQIQTGNVVRITGEVQTFDTATNPGMFDQQFYYQKQNIAAAVWADKIEILDNRTNLVREFLTKFRLSWKRQILDILGERQGQMMCAILLGERREMDAELKELYQQSGIGHILAISGLHLSFIGIGMYKILRRVTGSYPIGGVFGILFLVLYILMIGLTVSAVRALVMFLFRVGADMAGRHYDAPTALSVAAAVVLLWRPLSVYDGGFWLSFGAVFAILVVVPVVQEDISVCTLHNNRQQVKTRRLQSSLKQKKKNDSLPVYLRRFWEYAWQTILQGLTASAGINLVILPILLYYFYEFPLYSFVLNLFVIPLMSVLLFLGLIGSLFALWFAPVSTVLFWMCGKILRIYTMSCEISLGLPGARLVIGRPDMWQIAVYYGIMFLGLILLRYMILSAKTQEEQKRTGNQGKGQSGSLDNNVVSIDQNRKKKQIAVFFLWAVGIVMLTTRFGEVGELTTVVLDVGQGDGIFMRGPEGGTYLVDGGSSDVKKVGRYRLEPFLKSQGVGRLDYVLISHGDSDHMNGVEELIERQDIGVKIGTLVLPVKEVWDEALEELAEKARNHGICVVVIEPGQSIREGEMVITCIQPGNMEIKSENAESRQENVVPGTGSTGLESGNAASMVLAVRYGEFDMLLTGDVEGEGEMQLTKQLEERYLDCTWEVLKVAHHGSKNSSTEEFLHQAQPAYALISAGQENRYRHPHQETIKRLADVGSKVYSTQENGAIIVEVEGGELLRLEKWQR